MKLFARNKWPVVIPIYDGRQCPDCGAIVCGAHGQRIHDDWHDWLDGEVEEVPGESGAGTPRAVEERLATDAGYVVGNENGAYPELMRGGREGET